MLNATAFRAVLTAGAFLALAVPVQAADPYDQLAGSVETAAARGGARRVAVIPFSPTGRPDKEGGMVLAERLETRLAGAGDVQLVERTLLDRVLEEQKLGYMGLVDPRQAREVGRMLGVDAIVTGTFVALANNHVEVHARVIDAQTARVLGAAIVRVEKEWERDDEKMPVDAMWDVRAPDVARFPAPLVRLVPDPFRDAPNEDSCKGWEDEVDRLQTETLDLKARFWAARLADPRFDARTVTRNPGSEIRALSTRQRFYELVRGYHERGAAPLEHAERDSLEAADRTVSSLLERCY